MIGQTISHYKILEKLGEGGMGVVYKAHDTKLDRDVALKFLPRDFVTTPDDITRFEREAKAISALNHPHIATIHDIDEVDGQKFLVLEYIDGGTLKDKIVGVLHVEDPAKGGKSTLPDVILFAIQIAEGITHAHKRGIVHRDLKTANIMLTAEGQVKIADFGLAKLKDIAATQVTQLGSTVGTAGYMSPEQALGEEADQRSDIFSLGVIMYEMITGELPFKGQNTPAVLYAIVNTPHKQLMELRADVSKELQSIVDKALEKDADKRYQNAEDLLHDLQAIHESIVSGRKPVISIAPKRNFLIPSLIIAGLFILCLVWILTSGKRGTGLSTENGSSSLSSVTKPSRKSVAVIGFKNLSGRTDDSWISTALSEMLTTELSAGNRMRTIPGENVTRMKIDLSLSDAESFAKQTLDKIRDILGTDYVIMGSYLAAGGQGDRQIRIDLRIQDASMGETLAYIAEMGTESKIFDLVAKVGSSLREKLGIGNLPSAETEALRASYPINPEAVRLYSEGLIKLRTFDALQAKDLLLKAIATDSAYALAHSALAEAWNQLGYELKAKDEAEKAFHLSDNLPQEDKLLVEGRYREYAKEWDKAIELYKNLWNTTPDNIDCGIRYASTLNSAGKSSDGLEVISLLERLNSSKLGDPRLYLQESDIKQNLSDFVGQKETAQKAIMLAESIGSTSLAARARMALGNALSNQGIPIDAIGEYKRAMKFYTDIGYKFGVAKCLQNIGVAEHDQGHNALSIELWEKASKIFRAVGSARGQADILNNIGSVQDELGKSRTARAIFEECLMIERIIGQPGRIAIAQLNLGSVLVNQGYNKAAKETLTIGLRGFKKGGNKQGELLCLNTLANIDRHTGNLYEAQKTFAEVLEIAKGVDDKYSIGLAFWNIAFTLHMRGKLAQAKVNYDSALSIAEPLGDAYRIAGTELSLAQLAMDQNKFDNAFLLLKSALTKFREDANELGELDTRSLWAELCINQNNLQEATNQIDTSLLLTKKVNAKNSKIALGIVQARLLAARGLGKEGLTLIRKLIRKAISYGQVDIIYESRLALGEIEFEIGVIDSAKVHLNRLIIDASSNEYGRIAMKAEEALKEIGKK